MMEHYEESFIEHSNTSSLHNIININENLLNMDQKNSICAELDTVATQAQTVKQLTITLAAPANENIISATTTKHINKTQQNIEKQSSINSLVEFLEEEEEVYAEEEEQQQTSTTTTSPDLDDDSSSDSNISNLSEMSDISGRDWKPVCTRPIRWVQKQIQSGANPRVLLSQMLPAGNHQFAAHMSDITLWRILASMLSEPPRRQKLRHINTFDDVVSLVQRSKNIIVLTGAGVSVSCGIPDFRSSDGIYARLAHDYPDLPDPQAMFDINYFARDPRPFYKFAREIYPGQFRPSPCHRFIKRLEEKQQLLRNYTQNIDTLEQVAGISNVIECHGSFSTASCTKCKYKCSAEDIRTDIFAQRIPLCPRCQPNAMHSVHVNEPMPTDFYLRRMVDHGIMKPDIVFFGEGLPDEFHNVMASDKSKCDLLIVIGSSLKVRPVALIPSSLPAHVPQILINREQLPHLEFDVELLGDSDVIINQLCHRLGKDWLDICYNQVVLEESRVLLSCEGLNSPTSGSSSSYIRDEDELVTGQIDVDDEVDLEEDEEEEIETEESDEIPKQLDTDSQSVKSNASTDIALRSAGAYSDSGFESSTSSGGHIILIDGPASQSSQDDVASELDTDATLVVNGALVEPVVESALEASLEEIPEISELVAPLIETAQITDLPEILCVEPIVEMANELEKSIVKNATKQLDMAKDITTTQLVASCKISAETTSTPTTTTTTSELIVNNMCSNQSSSQTVVKRHHKQKRRNSAECLIAGTYYCKENKSAYVFPGAQVHWYTSSDDDDIDDEDVSQQRRHRKAVHAETRQHDEEKIAKKLHTHKSNLMNKIPLHTLSTALAAATPKTASTTVTATTATTIINIAEKRCSLESDATDATICTSKLFYSPPPIKKRRASEQELDAQPAEATSTSSVAFNSNSNSSVICSSTSSEFTVNSLDILRPTEICTNKQL